MSGASRQRYTFKTLCAIGSSDPTVYVSVSPIAMCWVMIGSSLCWKARRSLLRKSGAMVPPMDRPVSMSILCQTISAKFGQVGVRACASPATDGYGCWQEPPGRSAAWCPRHARARSVRFVGLVSLEPGSRGWGARGPGTWREDARMDPGSVDVMATRMD